MTAAAPLIGSPEDHERREREDEDGTAARRRIEAQQRAARWHADQQRTPRQRLADADRMLGPLGDPWIGDTDRTALQAERDLLAVQAETPPGITGRPIGVFPVESDAWHAARRLRVTSSEIGTICGWCPTNPRTGQPLETADDLLQRKLGLLPQRPPSAATERGNYCEPAVLAWFAATKSRTLTATKATWVHPDHDWLSCNPDALTTTGEIVEAKTAQIKDAEHGWGRAGTDQVPLHYAAQAQLQLLILGAKVCHMPVLFGQPFEFRAYLIKADTTIQAWLLEQATHFHAALTAALAKDAA